MACIFDYLVGFLLKECKSIVKKELSDSQVWYTLIILLFYLQQ